MPLDFFILRVNPEGLQSGTLSFSLIVQLDPLGLEFADRARDALNNTALNGFLKGGDQFLLVSQFLPAGCVLPVKAEQIRNVQLDIPRCLLGEMPEWDGVASRPRLMK